MERYNLALAAKKIYDSGICFFDIKSLNHILKIKKHSTFYFVLRQLISQKILIKIEKNKYLLENSKINDFTLSNFLYSPSYISFESALNYYGILPQFSYEITASTTKKTKIKKFDDKIFSYFHIKKELFWGYQKINDFLIALPEKAVCDYLYFGAKGLKKINIDELNLKGLNKEKIKRFISRYPLTKQTYKIKKILDP
jgi:hypothetical protein